MSKGDGVSLAARVPPCRRRLMMARLMVADPATKPAIPTRPAAAASPARRRPPATRRSGRIERFDARRLPWVVRRLEHHLRDTAPPVVTLIAEQARDPFRVLISTILSARTKD